MILRNIRQLLSRWQWIAALMLLCVVATGASAAVQEMRVVGVGVDSSSWQAEQIAMDYAKKRAVFLAARKLGARDAKKQIAKFNDETYKEVVRGMNVTQSRRAGEVTYLDVSVTLVDDALRRALKLPPDGPKHNDFKMRAVMLLPVYVSTERSYLWEKENILRAPLSGEVRRQSRGGVLLPGGDLQDLRLIDYQNALTVESEELTPMFDRYGTDEVIIAAAKVGAAGTMDATNIVLRRLERHRVRNEVIELTPEAVEETFDMRVNKAAVAIAAAVTQIASSTADRERAMREKAQKVRVRFSYAIPKELARMQEAVRAAPEVMFLDMPSIALARVSGIIYLKGSEEALRQALAKQGLVVTAIDDGWQLSVR
jgi:hypothetical protein